MTIIAKEFHYQMVFKIEFTRYFLLISCFCLIMACSKEEENETKPILDASKKTTLTDVDYWHGLTMDATLPANRDSHTPTIIYIHGGSWIGGDKSEYSDVLQLFADSGYACLSINYRFAGSYHYTDVVNDVGNAISYVKANAQYWQVSNSRIGLMGLVLVGIWLYYIHT